MNERVVERTAAISFLIAMVVLVVKAGAWWASGSVVLMADAAESSLDLVTALLLLAAVRFASRPADRSHPFGHSKAEYFSAGFQGALVLAAGVGVGVDGLSTLWAPHQPQELGLALALSVLATALNVGLAMWLIRVGRRFRSPALQADGRHNLADVVTTVGGWTGLGLAWATGWWILDPIVALLVAVHILWTGFTLVRSSVAGLMDTSLPEDELERLTLALHGALAPGTHLERMRSRRSARRSFVDVVLVVPGSTSVETAHALCDRLETAAAAVHPGIDVHIHVEPDGEGKQS